MTFMAPHTSFCGIKTSTPETSSRRRDRSIIRINSAAAWAGRLESLVLFNRPAQAAAELILMIERSRLRIRVFAESKLRRQKLLRGDETAQSSESIRRQPGRAD